MATTPPKRRHNDRGWRSYRDIIRDVSTIVVLAIALVAVAQANRAVTQQTEGRRIGQAVTCGALNAVIDAGRSVIRSGATGIDRKQLITALRRYNLPVARAQRAIAAATRNVVSTDQFARTVRRYGLEPLVVRRALSDAAAEAYARKVAERVQSENGVVSVVRKDGLLDCQRLRQVTGVSR